MIRIVFPLACLAAFLVLLLWADIQATVARWREDRRLRRAEWLRGRRDAALADAASDWRNGVVR